MPSKSMSDFNLFGLYANLSQVIKYLTILKLDKVISI